jgi:hypothetical protein
MSKSEFVKGCREYPLFDDWTQEALEALYEELKLYKKPIEFHPAAIEMVWVYHHEPTGFGSKMAWSLRHYYAIPNLKEEDEDDIEKVIQALREVARVVRLSDGLLVGGYF